MVEKTFTFGLTHLKLVTPITTYIAHLSRQDIDDMLVEVLVSVSDDTSE